MGQDVEELKPILERIANALESIAQTLNNKSTPLFDQVTKNKVEPKRSKNIDEATKEDNISVVSNSLEEASEIKQFLSSRGIRIKYIKPKDEESDEFLDKIAWFMGDRYSNIEKLYNRIKRSLNSKTRRNEIHFSLKRSSPEVIRDCTHLCNELHKIAFLEDYNYSKSPVYFISARVKNAPIVINFLTGEWLERYIRQVVIQTVKTVSPLIPFSYLQNVQVTLPDKKDFEFDLISKIGNEFFWFETKTSDYQKYVDRYSRVAGILSLDFNHTFMVLTDITEAALKPLCSLFKMRVVRIHDFQEAFAKAIEHLKLES